MKTSTVVLKDGSTAVSFVPELSGDKAIVHLSVIKQLVKRLDKAPAEDIVFDLIGHLQDDVRGDHNEKVKLAKALTTCQDFVKFHATVNMIELYQPGDITPAEADALAGIDRGIKAAQQGNTIED